MTQLLNQNLTSNEIFHLSNAIITVRKKFTGKGLKAGAGFVSTDIFTISVQRYGKDIYFTIIFKNRTKEEINTKDLTIGELEAIRSFAVKSNSEIVYQ